MKNTSNHYWKLLFMANEISGKVDLYSDEAVNLAHDLNKLRRLARKHHRLAEMSCNGAGWIRGQAYYTGQIDEYARRQYGAGVKSAYLDEDCELDVFDRESVKIEAKIKTLAAAHGLRAEFQGDPRGYTVRIFNGERDISSMIWE
jgi:hypothetical protein